MTADSRPSRWLALIGFSLVSLLAAALLLEIASWIVLTAYHRRHPDPFPPEESSPAYAGFQWAPAFWQEQALRIKTKARTTYVPFRIWGNSEWHGKFVNTDAGEIGIWRRTVHPTACDHPKSTVWVFGGSAIFGTGVPDDATIPSYLAGKLEAQPGACVTVMNFGVEGYVSTQELIVLTEQLKAGGRPDMVIFYDGFNDAVTGMDAPDPRSTHYSLATVSGRIEGTISARLDFLQNSHAFRLVESGIHRLHPPPASPLATEKELEAKAAAVLDNYQANLQIAAALGRAYNFRLYAFWQPSLLYGRKARGMFEEQITRLNADPSAARMNCRAITAAYQEAKAQAVKGIFVFEGELYDSVQQPVYIDEVHAGPVGNELAAEEIARHLVAESPANSK